VSTKLIVNSTDTLIKFLFIEMQSLFFPFNTYLFCKVIIILIRSLLLIIIIIYYYNDLTDCLKGRTNNRIV